ncbi:MAG TPA: hypothetical protein VM287_09030 [Egibacteraceae bacterium]|nr:hypothetical protein [Egibacteraceae bacterium]
MTAVNAALDDVPPMVEQFLTGYWSARTRANYRFILGAYFTWCAGVEQDLLGDADPGVVERWITDMQHVGSHSWHHTPDLRTTKGRQADLRPPRRSKPPAARTAPATA